VRTKELLPRLLKYSKLKNVSEIQYGSARNIVPINSLLPHGGRNCFIFIQETTLWTKKDMYNNVAVELRYLACV
jgi:hypothetical protein